MIIKGWKMKNTMKKFFKIKSEGDQFVEASICILATLICSVCIMLCFSVWMTQYSTNDSLNLIQTSYVKKMETTGYLSNEDEVSLKKELADAGIQNVSLSGTTFTKQAYGEPIELVIEGEVNLSNSGVKNFKRFAGTVEFLQKKLKIERFGKFTYNKKVAGTSKY
jgi:hypothetical protein